MDIKWYNPSNTEFKLTFKSPKNITFDEALKGGKVTEEKRNIFCSENEMNENKNDVHVTVGNRTYE
jgi:hypothetical protein